MSEPGGIWIYAIVPADADADTDTAAPSATSGITGVAGEPVRLVSRAGVTAAVGSVEKLGLDPESLRQHLQDPAWLERLARAHHQVVSELFARVPTVPFRLATVCRDDTGLGRLLSECGPDLRAALELVAGRAEWGVRAYEPPLDEPPSDGVVSESPAAAAAPPAAQDPAEPGAGPARPGTDYLRRRRAERAAREQRRRKTDQLARELHDALAAVAAHGRQLPRSPAHGQDRQPDQPAVLLNASYLVDQEHTDQFLHTFRTLREAHPQLRVRLSGPWPPYSFVEINQPESA